MDELEMFHDDNESFTKLFDKSRVVHQWVYGRADTTQFVVSKVDLTETDRN